jgi:hypothetical protein
MTTRIFLRRLFAFRAVTMRLLHTEKFELEEFGSNEVPLYAILSHT